MIIEKKPCSNWSYRGEFKPEIIVIHISTGSISSMSYWFADEKSNASSHYAVGLDGSYVQYVEESKASWSCGRVNNPSFSLYKPDVNPNLYTINIENEGQDLSKSPDVQFKALAVLIKDIATRNNIPIDRDHIIGHYQVDAANRPHCPSPDHSIMEKIIKEVYNIDIQKEEIINLKNNNMTKKTFIENFKAIFMNNRVKSFYWRTGMMVLAVIIQQAISLISTLQLGSTTTVLLGLILGEISKYINQSLSTNV